MKKNKKGFTLTEVLLIIWVLSILTVLWNSLFTNKLSDVKKLSLFTNNLKTNIENQRNNSLLWKSQLYMGDLINPKKRIVEIWVWNLTKFYIVDNWNNKILDQNYKENSLWKWTIKQISCYWLNDTTWDNINNLEIEFIWKNIYLLWCTNPEDKIIKVDTFLNNFTYTITINSVSWLIESNN